MTRLAWPAILLLLGMACAAGAETAPERPPRLATIGPHPKPVPTPRPEQIDLAIRRGAWFLVEHQNKDGSWGSARRSKGLNILAPVPGAHHAFRTATTALCLSALIETGGDNPDVLQAIRRGERWMFLHLPQLRRATPVALYNCWGHAYAIQALVHMHQRLPGDAKRRAEIERLIKQQLDRLQRYECVDGGWCYYDFNAHTQKPSGSSISFVTATVLVAMSDARRLGIAPPERLVKRAMASILRQRKPDFSYCYGEYLKMRPMRSINRPGGSLGRSQSCNLAMRLWGDPQVTDAVLRTWLDRLFARNLWLDLGRKRPIPHESFFSVAAYFYYYGHYYAARCIDELPAAERPPHQDQLAHILLRLQEKDGSWWDFPLYDYHQAYGTALAMMALERCRHAPQAK